MTMERFDTKHLEQAKKSLEHASLHRPGGLLVTERKALVNIKMELERRADIEYCKAHDC